MPKYGRDLVDQAKGKYSCRWVTSEGGRDTLRAIDLDWFTSRPETLANSSRIRMRFGSEMRGDVINKRASSANRQILWEVEATSNPLTSGLDLIKAAKGSIAKANIKGDRGHPCLVPLPIGKVSERKPEYLI